MSSLWGLGFIVWSGFSHTAFSRYSWIVDSKRCTDCERASSCLGARALAPPTPKRIAVLAGHEPLPAARHEPRTSCPPCVRAVPDAVRMQQTPFLLICRRSSRSVRFPPRFKLPARARRAAGLISVSWVDWVIGRREVT